MIYSFKYELELKLLQTIARTKSFNYIAITFESFHLPELRVGIHIISYDQYLCVGCHIATVKLSF